MRFHLCRTLLSKGQFLVKALVSGFLVLDFGGRVCGGGLFCGSSAVGVLTEPPALRNEAERNRAGAGHLVFSPGCRVS